MKDETMFAELLQRLNADGSLTLQEIMHATGMSKTSYYRWCSGESEPTATTLSLLIRGAKNADAREALLAFLTAGTGLILMEIPSELDLDGDGDVDIDDALEATASAAANTAEEIKRTLTLKRHGLTIESAARFREEAQRTIGMVMASVRIVENLASQESRRKKARPLAPTVQGLKIAGLQQRADRAQRQADAATAGGAA